MKKVVVSALVGGLLVSASAMAGGKDPIGESLHHSFTRMLTDSRAESTASHRLPALSADPVGESLRHSFARMLTDSRN